MRTTSKSKPTRGPMTAALLRLAAIVLLAGLSASCGGGPELPAPAGDGTDELRRSPCACAVLPQPMPGPQDLQRYRRSLGLAQGSVGAAGHEEGSLPC